MIYWYKIDDEIVNKIFIFNELMVINLINRAYNKKDKSYFDFGREESEISLIIGTNEEMEISIECDYSEWTDTYIYTDKSS